MRIFYSDHVELVLPAKHRFPMPKYQLLHERVAAMGIGELSPAEPVSDADLVRVHSAEYIHRVKHCQLNAKETRRIGFPNIPAMYQRAIHSVGGTVCAARTAVVDGKSAHLAGGTHHAHYDWGQGFCVFNDVMVASRILQRETNVKRILVIDLDTHQGNGTAVLAADDAALFTFSMHGARNFPFHKATSDLDVPLPSGTEDEAYLDALEQSLWRIFMLARADFVFYLSGADPYVGDQFGKLCLTKAGLLQRDEMVCEAVEAAGLPLALCMGGGYAKRVEDIVDIYAATVATVAA
ncbi:MAG: histone deacetylase [Candidatus Promineifilaceae bacterium]